MEEAVEGRRDLSLGGTTLGGDMGKDGGFFPDIVAAGDATCYDFEDVHGKRDTGVAGEMTVAGSMRLVRKHDRSSSTIVHG